ncbi:MAG: CDP-alcohol phosphatidyltransferase family protein [Paracoccaceae bacterium]|nr:CDP-alcohol phosphatidyltransferase family protein [Paracoccaceae bacterium]
MTVYRLVAAPVIAGMALAGQRDAFFILIFISLISDLVDGPIARWFGQTSRWGAKLDTIADACTVLAAILGLYLFEWATLQPELPWLYLFLVTYAAATFTSLAKFGVFPAYHLYSSKTAAFGAGVFFFYLYFFGYSRALFLGVVALGVIANLESLAVTLRLKAFRSDIDSLLFMRGRKRYDDG